MVKMSMGWREVPYLVIRLLLGTVLFLLGPAGHGYADVPDPLSCVAANAGMSQLLPNHKQLYLSKSLLFAFEHARGDVPADADWSDPGLRRTIVVRIDDVYARLPTLLATAAAEDNYDPSASALHCNGADVEFEIQNEVMILMVGEKAYNELVDRHVLHRR